MSSTPNNSDCLRLLLSEAERVGASDIHLRVGANPYFRTDGEIEANDAIRGEAFTAQELDEIRLQILNQYQLDRFAEKGSVDGALTSESGARFRFNIFKSGGQLSMAFRQLQNEFIPLCELGLTDDLYQVCEFKNGLILVAGPTGSGKSTTLATLVDRINSNKKCHIVTIEDPVEFIHQPKKSLINQRQLGEDTSCFHQALIDSMRQDPDVILVGEIRDLETIRTAITAAETGHLVFASVHAGDCVSAVERLISVFPAGEQSNIRHLLATSLRAVVAQHLLTISENRQLNAGEKSDDRPARNRVLASEVMYVNTAVSNLIANSNFQQIGAVLETSRAEGMYSLDHSLAKLLRKRLISEPAAKALARNPNMIRELSRKVS